MGGKCLRNFRLADDEHDPILAELEQAFDIETVTKEFFENYRELFLRTKEELDKVVKKDPKIKADFEDNGVDTVNFAKKLLGQIVFLYFLQKKGWFGVGRDNDWGTGSKHFLRELFEKKHADYNNFFNDILEPLFYDALRNDRSHDDGYYSRFNCKIPFLNGGLFDPIGNYDWVHTDIIIPDKLFSNNVKTKESDIGTGILDIFDRYNFTVKEDEPLEKEVAIDPELLGKAYEKFNAIRPDNFEEFKKALKSGRKGEENKFNKKFGVYYTPREIVHYMCQQSLINYLDSELNSESSSYQKLGDSQLDMFGNKGKKGQLDLTIEFKAGISIRKEDIETLIHAGEQFSENEARVLRKGKETKTYSHKLPESIRKNAKLIDEKLTDITVCDPAVGSGAFPVGMMSEIIRARNVMSTFVKGDRRTPYEFKRRCIEHSLYGVDIDPGAVEIAKLRLWLSLVVDEDDIKNIKPLPNLDYRIMQGNSLISEFMGINFDTDKEKKSENLMFKDETDGLIEHFQQKKDEFLNESNVTRKSKLKEEIEDLLIEIFESKLKKQKADYFNRLKRIEDEYSMSPNEKHRDEYIKQDKEKLYKESGFDIESVEKQLKKFTNGRKIKPFFLWNLYFSEVFHNKSGFDVVIANPPYLGQKGNKEKFQLIKLTEFGRRFHQRRMDYFYFFFHKAIELVKTKGIISFITTNYYITATYSDKLRAHIYSTCSILKLINFNELKIFESALGQHNMIALLIKDKNKDYLAQTTISNLNKVADAKILLNILNCNDPNAKHYTQKQNDLFEKETLYIRIEPTNDTHKNSIFNVLNKVNNQSQPLHNYCYIEQGIVSGADKISKNILKKYQSLNAKINEGVYVLTNKELDALNLQKEELKYIKKTYKNSDIKKWWFKSQDNLNILYIKSTGKYFDIGQNLKEHLDRFKILLINRNVRKGKITENDYGQFLQGKKNISYIMNASSMKAGNYYCISYPRRGYATFEVPKIVNSRRSKLNIFALENRKYYEQSDMAITTIKAEARNVISLDYILALLNSKLYYKWFYCRGKRKGETLELFQKPLSETPIKLIPENKQMSFIKLVDRILAITKCEDYLQNSQKQAKVKALEAEIDQLVYKLYGLTPDEIAIIEGEEK